MNNEGDFNDFDASWPPALLGPSDSMALVSLRDVAEYFSLPDDEEKAKSKEFISRLLTAGFDSTVNDRLRYWLNIWALDDSLDSVLHAVDEINAHLASS